MLELSCTQERHIRHQERLMNKNTIAIAIAALLVGGVSVAAFQQARGPDTADAAIGPGGLDGQGLAQDDAAPFDNSIPDGGRVASANVVAVEPIPATEKLYAPVIGPDPVRETSTSTTPPEDSHDVVEPDALPERHGNLGRTVAGPNTGGLV